MLRVALVGDSHLTDVSPRPVTKLGPRLRSMDFEVVTLARGGLDSREAIRHAPPDDVDWIVYSFGTNDAASWKQVPPSDIAGRVAQAHGAQFVALIEHLTELDLAEDGVHLDDLAYTTIATMVADILRPAKWSGTGVHAIPARPPRMPGMNASHKGRCQSADRSVSAA